MSDYKSSDTTKLATARSISDIKEHVLNHCMNITKLATAKSVRSFMIRTCVQLLHEFRRRANALATCVSGSPCIAHLMGLVECSLNTNRTGPE